ncbi:hypothetical protein [Halomarina ordinaria]|uniref:Outer membrane lipoprotein carrier protein LolA n=1 Tax=Halomarina ordinaria TaxID=3033939 RepID=A0ABD5U937_9EURY|nr:hypothetical protein [Halomarina sp. PSRA2]
MTRDYELAAVDLAGSQFTVEQTGRDENFRPEYEARDVTGDTVFRGTYNMYQNPGEFSFVDADGDEVVAVTASGALDIAGDYLLTDSQTGEDLVILENDLSPSRDTWRIRDADDRSVLAEINSRGALVTLGRKVLPFGQWIAHEYTITDTEGERVGSIESEFAMFDEYAVTLSDTSAVPTDPIVVGTAVIDAVQGT